MRRHHDFRHPRGFWDSSLQQPGKKRFLFIRFLLFFVPMVGIFIAGIMMIIKILYQPLQDVFPDPNLFFSFICGLPLLFGLIASIIGGLTFKKFGTPLVDLMNALEEVGGGDFTVRIQEYKHGEFGKMSRGFNRMVEQLAVADQNRRNLTADVAHELRTPLHIIQGNLEGMLDGVYEPTNEKISTTLDETRLLTRLVNDLQTLSLAEAGRLPLHCEIVSVADLISDTVTSFTGLCAEHEINLVPVIEGSDTELSITADFDRLSQVLNNLVANAIRFTPRGGTITLKTRPMKDGAQITIADTGCGINAEDLPFVFDRFWKAERSRSRHEGSGSGLGLAIARQLVQAHGGTIWVDSQAGEGTCFTIDLPATAKGC